MIRLFVGLGNPGPEYEDTRHNAGFWWIDALARGLKVTPQLDTKYFGLVARINDAPGAAGPIWLLQPMTYMNLSGKSVAALARFFKIAPEEILAIHDELEIAPGELKLKQGGGNAGHNGLKDMQAQLGSANFWRLRLGIGHPGHKGEVAGYVLDPAARDTGERNALDWLLEQGRVVVRDASLRLVDEAAGRDDVFTDVSIDLRRSLGHACGKRLWDASIVRRSVSEADNVSRPRPRLRFGLRFRRSTPILGLTKQSVS